MIIKTKLLNDKYRKARGGHSRWLNVTCAECDQHVCYYQKDGPGILKRLYLDRIQTKIDGKYLTCPKCKRLLGVRYIYEKEKRLAMRLFVGAVSKKIIKMIN